MSLKSAKEKNHVNISKGKSSILSASALSKKSQTIIDDQAGDQQPAVTASIRSDKSERSSVNNENENNSELLVPTTTSNYLNMETNEMKVRDEIYNSSSGTDLPSSTATTELSRQNVPRSVNRSFHTSNWCEVMKNTKPPESKYGEFKENCLSKGILFEDSDFPANNESLYFKTKPEVYPIVWKRPFEITPMPKFFHNGSLRFDVVQGLLGDCWLLASISCLTMAPTLLERCIPDGQTFDTDYAGIFHFRFWRYGKWIDVCVDDRLPTYKGKLIYLHSSEEDEFWTALMEKAYAKLYGSYEGMDGGLISWGLQDLTGGITDTINVRKDPKRVLHNIKLCLPRSTLLGAAISADITGGRSKVLPNGLVTGHAYSVTAASTVETDQGSVDLVRLRNPWGAVEWNGAWSDKSSKWKLLSLKDRELMEFKIKEDGEFWMAFDDFLRVFTSLELCHLDPDSWSVEKLVQHKRCWRISTAHRQWRKGFNAGGGIMFGSMHFNPQLKITLAQDSSIILSLMQKYRICKGNWLFVKCSFAVFRIPPDAQVPLSRLYFQYNRPVYLAPFRTSRENVGELRLRSGNYVVVPMTEAPNVEAKFMFRIFTEYDHTAKELDFKNRRLDHSRPQKQFVFTAEDKQMEKSFKKFANPKNNNLDAEGLQNVFARGLELPKQFLFCPCAQPVYDVGKLRISADTCKALIAFKSYDITSQMNHAQFRRAWLYFKFWRDVFSELQFRNRPGNMDAYRIREAVLQAGFSISQSVLEAIVMQHTNKGVINFEEFLSALMKLHTAHDKYIRMLNNNETRTTNMSLQKIIQMAIFPD